MVEAISWSLLYCYGIASTSNDLSCNLHHPGEMTNEDVIFTYWMDSFFDTSSYRSSTIELDKLCFTDSFPTNHRQVIADHHTDGYSDWKKKNKWRNHVIDRNRSSTTNNSYNITGTDSLRSTSGKLINTCRKAPYGNRSHRTSYYVPRTTNAAEAFCQS